MIRVEVLPRHTFRWWLRPPWQRMTLKPSRQYAQGVRWSIRLGCFTLTRFAGCSCGARR